MDLEKLENYLIEKILPDLRDGRPNDEPHTLLVVRQLKEILKSAPELNMDWSVLIIAAYAHDWGYTNLLDKSVAVKLEHLGAIKDTHMIIGSEKLAELLKDSFFDEFTEQQKLRAVHLVGIHDKLSDLKDEDELILMEADSLGGLDPEVMGVFSDVESEDRYLQKSRNLRFSKFVTEYSKREYERLYQKRINWEK